MSKTIGIAIVLLLLVDPGPAVVRDLAMVGASGRDVSTDSPAMLVPIWAASASGVVSPPPGVLAPDLLRSLRQVEADEVVAVILVLREQLAAAEMRRLGDRQAGGRSRLTTRLQGLSERTQGPLRAYLEGAQAVGAVESYRPFWIFNGVAVRARASVIRALSTNPAVATIYLDHQRQWIEPRSEDTWSLSTEATSTVAWGISHIRADEVWASLRISGTGAVVAGMDTGVDWLHPALLANYRGYNPHGLHNHSGNWFDAVSGGQYPFDDHGHGTHTIGTAAGRSGIGVAPGAEWIGVRVLNGDGVGYDSWIHAGFQWLVAPGGDPAKAPDVVNCSWGNNDPHLSTFQADLRVLRAAGILPVFSNGNNGPAKGTVGSPASLPEAFAVGAVDQYDGVATFSSRGPSPLPWSQIRPHVVAPGVGVRSSIPGGVYGESMGTSMAAPHVAGLAALLRSVSPTLSITRTAFLITSTAVPVGDPTPNNDAGWGRIDAFEAVVSLARPGYLSGTVSRVGDGAPIEKATLTAVLRDGGQALQTGTDEAGQYLLALAPGSYDVTAAAFGYAPATALGIDVMTGAVMELSFSLMSLPTGTVRVRVMDRHMAELTATVTLLGTPLQAVTSTYDFAVPAGHYVVHGRRLGYRVVTMTASVAAGETVTASLMLSAAPSILFLDSGPWYYGSEAGYFRQALDDLAYAFDEQSIRALATDVPTVSDLIPYDIVVWSAPWDSPGFIGAQDVLTDYLEGGGQLLLSGQDIGFLDAGGDFSYLPYYQDYLKSRLVHDNAGVWALQGVEGDLFAGMAITIAGSGGADNQVYPDEVAVTDLDSAVPVWTYQGRGCGGVRVGTCLEFRALYLSFGFEAINQRSDRQEVMRRALDWLWAPAPTVGVELTPAGTRQIGVAGTVVTHTVRLRHLGQRGMTDTFILSSVGHAWDTSVTPSAMVLTPCASGSFVVSVTIPAAAGWNAQDIVSITARSSISPSVSGTAVLTTKTPAPILLVDDDRWYDQQAAYRHTMDSTGLPYDLWEIEPDGGSSQSPTAEGLARYPLVVWWTGYDWYRPVTVPEREALGAYLQQGGRLFLSSQDFLLQHFDSEFAQGYLGVLTYTEFVTTMQVWGVREGLFSDGFGPYELDFPFANWSDAVQPTSGTAVLMRDQERRGVGLSRRADGYATVFLGFPFEALPQAARPVAMRQIVGWLSWLGGSTWQMDRRSVAPGSPVTYTLTLRNDGWMTVTASFTNTLPDELTWIPGSSSGPAAYAPGTRTVAWTGSLAPGDSVTVSYAAEVAPALAAGSTVTNIARLRMEDQGIEFERLATLWVGGPDLSASALSVSPSESRSGDLLAHTLTLANDGLNDASLVTSTIFLWPASPPLPGTLRTSAGTTMVLVDTVRWTTSVSAGSCVTLTYVTSAPPVFAPAVGCSVAFVEGMPGGTLERWAWIEVSPRQRLLPIVYRQW